MSGVTGPAQPLHRHLDQCRPVGRFGIDLPPGSRIRKSVVLGKLRSKGASFLGLTLALLASIAIVRHALELV